MSLEFMFVAQNRLKIVLGQVMNPFRMMKECVAALSVWVYGSKIRLSSSYEASLQQGLPDRIHV